MQRVQVLASGKYKFVKNKGTRKSNPSRKRKRSVRRRVRTYMARRKKRRNNRQITIPLATLGGIMAMPAVNKMVTNVLSGSFQYIPNNLAEIVKKPKENLLPLFTGILVSMIASKLGVNRKLAQHRIPFIRI